jgi:hypothetical protein
MSLEYFLTFLSIPAWMLTSRVLQKSTGRFGSPAFLFSVGAMFFVVAVSSLVLLGALPGSSAAFPKIMARPLGLFFGGLGVSQLGAGYIELRRMRSRASRLARSSGSAGGGRRRLF